MPTGRQPARPTHYRRTLDLATAALVTALIAASAWITLPLGAVPVTLQVFFVVLAALLLPPGWAAASMLAYVVLGAAGLPVFSGAQGGLGVLAGPTGGYLIGFVAGATLGSVLRLALQASDGSGCRRHRGGSRHSRRLRARCGAARIRREPHRRTGPRRRRGAVPPGDAVKAAVAVGVAAAVRRARY